MDNFTCKNPDWLLKNSPTAYKVFRFLLSNLGKSNALVCSYKVMQEKLGYSRTTLSDSIRFLKQNHFIQILRSGTSNVYSVNQKIRWNKSNSHSLHAEFNAKVIISSSEQDHRF